MTSNTKMVRDALGSPIPQTLNSDGTYSVLASGNTNGIDFSKHKMLRDALGSPLPYQYFDVAEGKFVPGTIGGSSGGGAVDSVNGKTGNVNLIASDVGAASTADLSNLSQTTNQKIDEVTTHLAQDTKKIEKLEDEKAAKSAVEVLANSKAEKTEVENLGVSKADKAYVDTLVSNLANGGPRDVFYSIEALRTVFPTGEIGTYLVYDSSFTDGAHSFIWDGAEWVDLGVYQATGINDDTITPEKLATDLKVKQQLNLYDATSVVEGGYYGNDGVFVTDSFFATTDFIPVKHNTFLTRTTAAINGTGTNIGNQISFWDANGMFVDGLSLTTTQVTFVVPNNPQIKTMRVSLPKDNRYNEIMVVEGNKLPERYYKNEKSSLLVTTDNYDEGSITAKKISFDVNVESVNIFDASKTLDKYYYNYVDGSIVNANTYSSSDLISVEPNQKISRTITSINGEGTHIGNQVTYWDVDGNFVVGADIANNLSTFAVPNNPLIKFMRISLLTANKYNAMLVYGDKLPPSYVAYKEVLVINNQNIKESVIDTSKLTFDVSTQKINLFDKNAIIKGGYYDYQTGIWTANVSFNSTDKIACAANDVFSRTTSDIVTGGSRLGNQVAYFDTNDNFVVGVEILNVNSTFTVPNDPSISYMRISVSNLTKDNAMLVYGDTLPSVYVPYSKDVVAVDTHNIKNKAVENRHIKNGTVTKDKLAFEVLEKENWGDNFVKEFPNIVNPILTKDIVTDRINPTGVADPFIVEYGGVYHAFFEVLGGLNPNTNTTHDEIGHAYSVDLRNWTYTQIVYGYELHGHRAAFPNVKFIDGEWYMLPDITGDIKVYKATNFPLEWTYETTLRTGAFVDSDVFKIGDNWYLITSRSGDGMRMYTNTSGTWLNDQWTEHPSSPLFLYGANNETQKRLGGRVAFNDGLLYIPVQAQPLPSGVYGQYLDMYKINNLTPTNANVVKMGRLLDRKQDGGWASKAMHHICGTSYLNKTVYMVDGLSNNNEYSIGLMIDV